MKTEYVTSGIAGLEFITSTGSRVAITPHTHVSTHTILLVRSGRMRIATAGGVISLRAGSCTVFPPHFRHSLQAVSEYALLCLCIDVSAAGKRREITGFLESLVRGGHLSTTEKDRFTDAQENIVPGVEEPNDALRTLKEGIIALPEQEITLADMAEHVHLDKFHLIRTFKKRYGLSPSGFVRQNRLRKARKRLRPGGTLTQAALAAGFYDQSHFIRHFKQLHGLTPRQYLTSREHV